MGECPDWFELLEAADLLHCRPWELVKQPQFWIDAAYCRAAALEHARNPTGGDT
jgi:hypothetical protein